MHPHCEEMCRVFFSLKICCLQLFWGIFKCLNKRRQSIHLTVLSKLMRTSHTVRMCVCVLILNAAVFYTKIQHTQISSCVDFCCWIFIFKLPQMLSACTILIDRCVHCFTFFSSFLSVCWSYALI